MPWKVFFLSFLFAQSFGFYSDSSVIVDLNTNNFDKLVKNTGQLWLVEFFAPWCGHCQRFASEYVKAASALNGFVKIGAVNADENPSLVREHDIRGYPTVKIFNTNHGSPQIYEGKPKASALVSSILLSIHSTVHGRLDGNLNPSMFQFNEVTVITDSNFGELVLAPKKTWLVVFYSFFCDSCNSLSTQWVKVATELQGLISLGALDGVMNFGSASECKIEGYPAIQFFPLGEKNMTSGIQYKGKRSADDVIQWTLEKLAENAPILKVVQIVDLYSLQEACEHKPLCIVSFLPDILDCKSKCRNEYLDTLRKVSENFKRSLWGWVWSEAGAQPEMEAALEIGGFGYPTMVAVNVKKMKYSLFVGSFCYDGMSEFLRGLSFGRGDTKPITLKEVPRIREIEPWDGLDAELPSTLPPDEEEEGEEDVFEEADSTEPTKDEL